MICFAGGLLLSFGTDKPLLSDKKTDKQITHPPVTIAGFIAFLFVGLILGLVGGGGSILGVPILVYLFGYGASEATSYSLFIVGVTSLIGAITYLQKGEINFEAILRFAIGSMITVFCIRRYVMPAIPEAFHFGEFSITKHALIMFLFAVLILFSSMSMIRKRKVNRVNQVKWDEYSNSPLGLPTVILLGVMIGCITGFVGAGGGFIIVPILIFFLRLTFKKAIGTSLFIIAINSLVGFSGNIGQVEMNWKFLLCITSICVAGIIIGSSLSGKISSKKLKPAFGWFTLIVGTFILVKEIFIH